MNGAQALITTLVDGGVDVCFANPGTSEMHFVAALDTRPGDARRADPLRGCRHRRGRRVRAHGRAPAAVLLHLGPGLGNGLANLHNARRARTPMVTRRRPRHLPQEVRRPAGVRHRRAGRHRVGLGAPHRQRPPTSAPDAVGRDRRRRGPAGSRHADPAGRRLLVRRRRGSPRRSRRAPPSTSTTVDAGRQGAAERASRR